MSVQKIYYFPRLHKEFLKYNSPVPLTFIAPCLQMQSTNLTTADEKAFAQNLPLSPAEAHSILNEMLHTGTEQWQNRTLSQMTLVSQSQQRITSQLHDEYTAINTFMQKAAQKTPLQTTGCTSPLPIEQTKEERIANHTLLLLMLTLEKSVLEAQSIADKYLQAQQELQDHLHDAADFSEDQEEMPSPAELAAEKAALADMVPVIPYSWKVVLKALFPFMPQGALLYTDDPETILEVTKLYPYEPLEAEYESTFLQSSQTQLNKTAIPVCQLLGTAGKQTEKTPECFITLIFPNIDV